MRLEGGRSEDSNIIGLVAVVMIFGSPLAALYTYYHVRKLRTEERLAALARGVDVQMQPDLSQPAQSRRSGILLVAGAIGYMLAFALMGGWNLTHGWQAHSA